MNFKIGERVVCINAKSANTPRPPSALVIGNVLQGQVYTIIDIVTDDGVWLTFKEIGLHTEFGSTDFRKLDYEFVDKVLENINKESIKSNTEWLS